MTFGGRGRYAEVGTVNQSEADAMVGAALDAGIVVFDTAPAYSSGLAEEMLGRSLGSSRTRVQITSKYVITGARAADEIVSSCHDSLRRLRTDYLDCLVAHHYPWTADLEVVSAALSSLQRTGAIRTFGCANFTGWQLWEWTTALTRPAVCQCFYSLAARDAEHTVIPAATALGIDVQAWGVLAGGFLGREQPVPGSRAITPAGAFLTFERERAFRVRRELARIAVARGVSVAQVALNWVLSRPCVSTVILGARNQAQLGENLAAVQWRLSPDEYATLEQSSQPRLNYPYWLQRRA